VDSLVSWVRQLAMSVSVSQELLSVAIMQYHSTVKVIVCNVSPEV